MAHSWSDTSTFTTAASRARNVRADTDAIAFFRTVINGAVAKCPNNTWRSAKAGSKFGETTLASAPNGVRIGRGFRENSHRG